MAKKKGVVDEQTVAEVREAIEKRVRREFGVTAKAAAMPQVFRIKPTSNSGSGTVCVTVNGTLLDTRLVAPGQTARWFVPETLLVAGTTNVLELARTESGSDPVTIDSAVIFVPSPSCVVYQPMNLSPFLSGWLGRFAPNGSPVGSTFVVVVYGAVRGLKNVIVANMSASRLAVTAPALESALT